MNTEEEFSALVTRVRCPRFQFEVTGEHDDEPADEQPAPVDVGGRSFDRLDVDVRGPTVTNVGILPGLNADGWRDYPLEMKSVSTNPYTGDGAADPILRTANSGVNLGKTTNFARCLIVDHSFVVVEIMATFFVSGDQGNGGAYVFKLPFPAYRMTGPGNPCPVPLSYGAAMAYWTFSDPWVTVPLIPTLADPFSDLAGRDDEYAQCYTPYRYQYGTYEPRR